MSAIIEGAACRVKDKNNHWVSATVTRTQRGQVQVRTATGHCLWRDSQQVKHKLILTESEDVEDSSSSDSEEERKRVALAEPKTKHVHFSPDDEDEEMDGQSNSPDGYRQRSKSTAIEQHEDDDIYDQLREEWTVGSIVEIWSETAKKWVVAQIEQVLEFEQFAEPTLIVLYMIENPDGAITTIKKGVLFSSEALRPHVNRLYGNDEDTQILIQERDLLMQKNQELSETNDEFLLTIDHQSQKMEQLQEIFMNVSAEEEHLEKENLRFKSIIEEQKEIINALEVELNLAEELEDSEDEFSVSFNVDE